jgi:hypothetical protein
MLTGILTAAKVIVHSEKRVAALSFVSLHD